MSEDKSTEGWVCVHGVWVLKPAPAGIVVVGFKPAADKRSDIRPVDSKED